MIVNLLINACDAMGGKGSITLTLDSHETTPPAGKAPNVFFDQLPEGRYVTLSIRDEGPGIAAEHLDRIFEPFLTTKAFDRGICLGLSVVQGIMARHSGALRATSAEGEGACFVLILPAQEQLGLSSRSREIAVRRAGSFGGTSDARKVCPPSSIDKRE